LREGFFIVSPDAIHWESGHERAHAVRRYDLGLLVVGNVTVASPCSVAIYGDYLSRRGG
jgi:hypothetical protein